MYFWFRHRSKLNFIGLLSGQVWPYTSVACDTEPQCPYRGTGPSYLHVTRQPYTAIAFPRIAANRGAAWDVPVATVLTPSLGDRSPLSHCPLRRAYVQSRGA